MALPITNGSDLRREWYGSRSGEGRGKRGEDAEVSVKRHTVNPPYAERAKPGLVLESTEAPLYGTASAVENAPPL